MELSTAPIEWYFMPNEKGLPPARTREADLLEAYGGYGIGSPEERVIYITFDMGYENGHMPQILDTLKKHDAKAAFFVVKHYIDSEADLVKRMVAEGHLVCNHSTHHKNMAKLTDFAAFAEEMQGVADAFEALTGQRMAPHFRPPSGQYSELCLSYAQRMGYHTIMWSFAYADWDKNKQPAREQALAKIYPRTHNGEIALLHGTSATNAAILDEVLTEWENRGFAFGTLDQLVQSRRLP